MRMNNHGAVEMQNMRKAHPLAVVVVEDESQVLNVRLMDRDMEICVLDV